MRLRASLIAPAIDAGWFSQFIEELELETRALEFDSDGQMSPPTTLRLVRGTHARQGAHYEMTTRSSSGATSTDDLVVDEWSSKLIAVTNTDNEDVSRVRFLRDSRFGLRRFEVEMTDRSSSGLALRAYVDTEKLLTNDGDFTRCTIKHKVVAGSVVLRRSVSGEDWSIEVEILVHGRGLLRPILTLLLVLARPVMARWLRRSVGQISRQGIPQLRGRLATSPDEAARETVRAWLAQS